jgi:hypothetical protein
MGTAYWCVRKDHGVKKNEYFVPLGRSRRNYILNELVDSPNLENVAIIVKCILDERYHINSPPTNLRKKEKVGIYSN